MKSQFHARTRPGSRQAGPARTTRAVQSGGFTLIEMLVSVGLFAIVMIVCVGALLALVGANKKAHALESTINNLNISLDDMVRNAREGSGFDGSLACTGGNSGGPQDCTGGGTEFAFVPYGGGPRWIYWFSNAQVWRTVDGNVNDGVPITSPEVTVTAMSFYVVGTIRGAGDTTQPRVIVVIKGTAGGGRVKDQTTFHLQATAVQRALDL